MRLLLIGLLAGCSPVAAFRPLVPLTLDDPRELSVGVTGVIGGTQSALGDYPLGAGVNLEAWLDGRLGERVVLGGGLFAGQTGSVGAGLGLRWLAVKQADRTLGLALNGGLLWVDVGVPMAWRLDGEAWVYSEPSFGLRQAGLVYLPVGLRLPLGTGWSLDVEAGVSALYTGLYLSDLGVGGRLGAAVAGRF